jgi:hypothetical protein
MQETTSNAEVSAVKATRWTRVKKELGTNHRATIDGKTFEIETWGRSFSVTITSNNGSECWHEYPKPDWSCRTLMAYLVEEKRHPIVSYK